MKKAQPPFDIKLSEKAFKFYSNSDINIMMNSEGEYKLTNGIETDWHDAQWIDECLTELYEDCEKE